VQARLPNGKQHEARWFGQKHVNITETNLPTDCPVCGATHMLPIFELGKL